MMNSDVDAIVIGGGPAGATTALLLARFGWSVALIEKKSFPRTKVCGEFISATSFPLLSELGLSEFYLQHAGPSVTRVGWFGAEKMLMTTMPPVEHSDSKWGRALGREQLDTALLLQAIKAGVHVWQPWTAQTIIDKKDSFTCILETKEKCTELSARTVIIAQGSWEKPVIRMRETAHKNSDLLAFKTHFQATTLDQDLMSLLSFPGGYGGLVHSDSNRVSLSCCIRRDVLQKLRLEKPGLQASDVVLNHILSTCKGAQNVLGTARREESWLSVGPLHPGIRRCYDNGLFFVGNIAGEAHPIIAEGISMAMQSGWLLATSLINGPTLTRDDLIQVGYRYSKKWHKQFASRIYAAAFFAHLTSRRAGMKVLLPLVARFPGLLTFGATLSGKNKTLPSFP
ncbi:NAD(P)/FAD-dependent oxidoreductase [Legionella hackeliae]|uniref:Protein CbrA n=1 Tax=Legionella hackeliae TaxID=449 RepID=A0A0A8UYP0_LEGHA|nr:NAD(P)/FAD-dependent oxidoreductase [Legionella hackeliae]KTD12818.1 FAD dependent oxidoreductase [Legionella hackeliae]CEK12242.1 putative FAD dependent oxidoreductase [Legionella hackeliae]STX49029.1 FAD dependent oxidoreductase [Legionella hackeliae]